MSAVVREVELEGHIIDSLILTKVFDKIMDMGGNFRVLEFDVGKRKTEVSYAKILVIGRDEVHLDEILSELYRLGARLPEIEEVSLEEAKADKVAPENFYVTTNHPTYIRYKDDWLRVERISMDKLIVVNGESAICKPISEIREGDKVVVGERGIRVTPPERPRDRSVFEFMSSVASSERPSLVRQVANEMTKAKSESEKVALVAGPAVVHTGGSPALAEIIRKGYVDVLLAGNALAVHEIEYNLFGTSLGMDVETGKPVAGGHKNHLRAISKVISCGSIKDAVSRDIITGGIMYECVKNNIPFVLAGSIRDDGPLPEVITDVVEAQTAMRDALGGVKLVIMLATALHSIAVGNLISSDVKTICVDINSSTISKLMDRGTAQAMGIVTDVGAFSDALSATLPTLRS